MQLMTILLAKSHRCDILYQRPEHYIPLCPGSHNIIDQLIGIPTPSPHQRHHTILPLDHFLHDRSLFQISGAQERHTRFQHIEVALMLDLALGPVWSQGRAQILFPVVDTTGWVVAVLGVWVIGVAKANDELARLVVQAVLVESAKCTTLT